MYWLRHEWGIVQTHPAVIRSIEEGSMQSGAAGRLAGVRLWSYEPEVVERHEDRG